MQIIQKFRDHLPRLVTEELEQIIESIRHYWGVEHKEDGTHGHITCDSITVGGVAGGGGSGTPGPPGPAGPPGADGADGVSLISTGPAASLPDTHTAGDLYFPNDGVHLYPLLRECAGIPWGPVFPMTRPVDADFAWVNQGGASVVSSGGGIFLRAPISAGSNLRLRVKAAPATPYTITAALLITGLVNGRGGLCWRNSVDGKIATYDYVNEASFGRMVSATWASAVGAASNYLVTAYWHHGGVLWLRIADNGTSRICSYSLDGQNFLPYHTIARTDILTPDQVGFFAYGSGTFEAGVHLLSWKQA